MLSFSLRFLFQYHFCPSSRSSCKYRGFQFFIFTDRMWVSNSCKNLTVLWTTLCKYCLHGESFNVSHSLKCSYRMSFGPHQVNTVFPEAVIHSLNQLVWLIFPLNWPKCRAVWASAGTFTQREGRLLRNLLNEGDSFLLRCATDY